MGNNSLKHLGEMTTVSEIINELTRIGYTIDLNLDAKQYPKGGNLIKHSFVIDEYFRFEGESDPADEAIVYAISSVDGSMKGILIDGYGTSSENQISVIIKDAEMRTDKPRL